MTLPSGAAARPRTEGGPSLVWWARVVDPRLFRHATAARGYLLAAIALGHVVLDRGKVVQRGTQDQLMCTGGRYRRLRAAGT